MAKAKAEKPRPGRNERCHCGSDKKYKRCCLTKDEAADRAVQAKAAKAAKAKDKDSGDAKEAEGPARRTPPRPGAEQPWKRSGQNTRGFQKFTGPRKVGGG